MGAWQLRAERVGAVAVRRSGRWLACGLAALCMTLPLQADASGELGLRICYESEDVHPWSTRQGTGLNHVLLGMAASATGVVLQQESVPWKRCLAMLKSNEVDGAFAASFKPDRVESGVYPIDINGKLDAGKRLHMDRYVLVRRKGSKLDWNGSTIQNLAGPVGAQLGYSVVDQLRQLGVQVDEGTQSAHGVLRKLLLGRIGGAALLSGEVQAVLVREPEMAAALEVLPLPLVEKPYFLMLSYGFMRRNEQAGRSLWANIERLRESAVYQAQERKAFSEARK
jgi:polar amino acid transport system substrate-binding protein